MVKIHIDKKKKRQKIQALSQECAYHLHEELIIFPVFSKLKIFKATGKYQYYQLCFRRLLQQNTIKS